MSALRIAIAAMMLLGCGAPECEEPIQPSSVQRPGMMIERIIVQTRDPMDPTFSCAYCAGARCTSAHSGCTRFEYEAEP